MCIRLLLSLAASLLFCNAAFGLKCASASHSIEQVQGIGMSSPFDGETVTVSGVVSAVFQQPNELNGFFIQSKDENPNASHGLFIYSKQPVTLQERIVVQGRVKEFYGLTELVSTRIVERCKTTQLIEPVKIDFELTAIQREALEGVLVELPAGVLSSTYGLLKYGQLELSPYWPNRQTNNRWLLDDASTETSPDSINYLKNITDAVQLLPAARAEPVTGIISFSFDHYRILALEPIALKHDIQIEKKAETSTRIASFNVQNLFNGNGQGSEFLKSRGPENQSEWQRQLAKISATIKHMNADVLVLNEIENDGFGKASAVAQLISALNKVNDTPYRVVEFSPQQTGNSAIKNVIIYNSQRVKTAGKGLSILQYAGWQDGRHRPFLLQGFIDKNSGEPFNVVAVHLKSKAGQCPQDTAPLKAQYGACSLERGDAISQLNRWLEELNVQAPIFLVGDFNALPDEPATTILSSSEWQTPFELDQEFSYVYRGQANLLDYIWLKPAGNLKIVDAHYWGINAGSVYPNGALADHAQFKTINQAEYLNSSDHNPLWLDVQFIR